MKTCYRCEQPKPLEAFAIDNSRNSKDGRQNACRPCKAKIQRAYRAQRTPEQVRKALDYNIALRKRLKIERPGHIEAQNKDSQLKTKYKINLQIYNDMFAIQKGLCLGCYRHSSEFNQSLAVDHNHITGEIRGLLCINCNRTLGYGKDNPAILRRLADYLERKNP
jgi:Autographiviridae endonuclease VII